MLSLETLYNFVVNEKKQKKELTGYDYYKMIRKPTPPSGTAFKNKKKYFRKEKYKTDYSD